MKHTKYRLLGTVCRYHYDGILPCPCLVCHRLPRVQKLPAGKRVAVCPECDSRGPVVERDADPDPGIAAINAWHDERAAVAR